MKLLCMVIFLIYQLDIENSSNFRFKCFIFKIILRSVFIIVLCLVNQQRFVKFNVLNLMRRVHNLLKVSNHALLNITGSEGKKL